MKIMQNSSQLLEHRSAIVMEEGDYNLPPN